MNVTPEISQPNIVEERNLELVTMHIIRTDCRTEVHKGYILIDGSSKIHMIYGGHLYDIKGFSHSTYCNCCEINE